MKAIIPHPDRPNHIAFVERPKPIPAEDELLIRVAAFGINRADLLQVKGLYPTSADITDVLGLELSGEVIDKGAKVTRFGLGEQVCALVDGGAYAEYVLAKEGMTMSFAHADSARLAAIPESFLTAYQALFLIGQLTSDQNVLIHSAVGSVGSSAIQLAKSSGARVFATCSTSKLPIASQLGSDVVIDYKNDDFAQVLKQKSPNGTVDLILDFVGSAYFDQNIRVINTDGRWLLLGLLGGHKVKQVNLSQLLFKRVQLIGSTLRTRSYEYKKSLTCGFMRDFGALLEEEHINPLIDSVLDWSNLENCFTRLQSNETIGKMICTIS